MTSRTGLARLGRLQRRRDEGQTIVIVALCMVVFLGMAGLVIDLANLYVTQRHLQTAADAAALAAAQDLPNSTTSACTYSASTAGSSTCTVNGANVSLAGNGDNYASTFGNVQTTAQVECVSAASAGTSCQTGTACSNPAGYPPTNGQGCNAIKVTERTTVTPFFMGVLGFGDQTVTASATAGIAGGTPEPLDVEMIDDTTASMGDADTCGGTPTDVPSTVSLTQEDCAKAGIRALLTTLEPCAQSLASCGPFLNDQTQASGGAVDEVGLVLFPGLTGLSSASDGSISNELDCTSNISSSNVSYGSNANYQAVPFSSDFRYSDASTSDSLATLNTSSNLVRAVYWPGDGCPNGGYPISGGAASSISGGTAGDITTASTAAGATIGGGASTSTDTSNAVNAGITQGKSTATTNTAGVTQGNSKATSVTASVTQGLSTATSNSPAVTQGSSSATTGTALTISGGPNSGSSNDRSTATVSNAMSIPIARPGTTLTRTNSDFLLLTITGQGTNVTSSSNICPSSTTTGWTLVDQRISGTLIQATYSSAPAGTANATYTFNFMASTACSGAAGTLSLTASAVALRYSNVASVDAASSGSTATTTNDAGSAASIPWTTATFTNSSIANVAWGTTTVYASVSSGNQCTTSSACDTTVSAGTMTGATFTLGSAVSPAGTYTVTLLINNAKPGTGTPTCTFSSGKTCTISGSWAVSQGATVSLSVARSTSTQTTTATAAATESPISTYVSLSSSCTSSAAGTCDVASVPSPGGSLTSASITFATAVPSGDTMTVTLERNGADTTSTCTVAAAAKTCTIPGGLVLATGDLLELKAALTGGTTAFTSTATTAAAFVTYGTTLTAPAITTAQAHEQVVRLYGTSTTGFSGTAPAVTATSGSTATGADDAAQASAGSSGTATATVSPASNWVAQTVALVPTPGPSITVMPPADYSGNSGDLMLVSVAVQNLGTGTVCAPDSTWTALTPSSSGTGATKITQASFWTTSSTAGSDTFTFYAGATCSGGTTAAAANAVATTYDGVDTTNGPTVTSGGSATGTTLTAPQNATVIQGTEVVSLFASAQALTGASPSLSAQTSPSSPLMNVGESARSQAATGNQSTQATATIGSSATWSAQTVDLRPALPWITVTPPSDYSGNSGDLLLVSIAAQALGSGVVCAPDATWHSLTPTSSGAGASELTQATFWTTASTASTDQFNFKTMCTGGTSLTEAANAVATTYDGVDTTNGPTVTSGGATSGTSLTAPQNTTAIDNEEVVNLFATSGAFASTPAPSPTFTTQTSPSSTWAHIAESASAQGSTGNQATQATAASSSSATWTAQTVDLRPQLSSSITITPPSDYAGKSGDLLLVSIAAQGLGSGVVCAPDSSWTALTPTSSGSGGSALTQATFYTYTSTAGTDQFSFETACTGGSAVSAAANAVATTYDGVDPGTPLTVTSGGSSSGTSLNAPQNATAIDNEEVVNLFATTGAFAASPAPSPTFTIQTSPSSVWTNVAESASAQNVSGSQSKQASATSSSSATWTVQTVDLTPLLSSSITVTPPSDYSGNSGDLLLVSVAVQDFSGVVCAPDSTWTSLSPTSSGTGSDELTQATFYTYSSTASSDAFALKTSCSSGTSVTAAANAVATTYDGVDPATAPTITSGGAASGTTLTAPQNGTKVPNEEVVNLFATTGAFAASPAPSPAFTTQTSPSSVWTNVAESASLQQATGNQSPQASAGSSSSATWTAQTVDLTALLSSSVTITPPSGYLGGGADLLLVSVSAQNLGSGSICAPDATWTAVPVSSSPVGYTVTSGTLTQETFYTTASEATSDTFTFYAKASCSGAYADVGATAVAVAYTGVNPAAPIDGNATVPSSSAMSSSPLVPAAVTTHAANEKVVTMFGSAAPTLTGPTVVAAGNYLAPSAGINNATVATAGSYSPSQATSAPAAENWTAETIALTPLTNDGITIARPPSPTSSDFLLVTVTTSGLASNGTICAPDDGSWTQVGSLQTSGAVNQATFYSSRASTNAESYTFTFQSACSTTGTPLGATGTAVAVRYTGVNPITPIDTSNSGTQEYSQNPGSGTSVVANAVTPQRTGDYVVAFYGTGATSLSNSACSGSNYSGFTQTTSSATATGFCAVKNQAANQSYAPPAATANANKAFATVSIALEASYGSCGSSCQYGVEDPGGVGTDYGLAIAAAETQLDNEAATRPTARKVIILLSDGDANQTDGGITNNPCQYGITQAENAEQISSNPNTVAGNTWIYTIAYGAIYAAGQSCTDDTSGNLAGLSAQCAMILMANNSATNAVYANDTQAKAALCPSPAVYAPSDPAHRYYNQAVNASLENVFTQVGDSLSTPRLISDSAT